jgi:ribonuclease HI
VTVRRPADAGRRSAALRRKAAAKSRSRVREAARAKSRRSAARAPHSVLPPGLGDGTLGLDIGAPVRTPPAARPRFSDITICIDGASRGNPGRAAIGVVVLAGGEPVREIAERIGIATNNVAEYKALLRGLQEAAALGAATVHVQSDSELLVRQLLGQYKVRHDALIPLHRDALARMRNFEHVHVFHVPRVRNAPADALANEALDAQA